MGSQRVTLRQFDAESLEFERQELQKAFSISGYGAGTIQVLWKARAPLRVDEATAEVTVYIVPDEAQGVPLLIGQLFTEQPHVTIVRRGKCLRLFH